MDPMPSAVKSVTHRRGDDTGDTDHPDVARRGSETRGNGNVADDGTRRYTHGTFHIHGASRARRMTR